MNSFRLSIFSVVMLQTLSAAYGQDAPAPAQSGPAAESPPSVTAALQKADGVPLTPGSVTEGVQLGQHRFILSFEPTALDGMGLVRSKFRNEGVFQLALDSVADQIALPTDIPVTFKDCGFANAFWSPDEQNVTMCWDLISLYNRSYEEVTGEASAFLSDIDQDTALTSATLFILMHELGHGLTSLYQLPITGREEDAVDQFSTLLMVAADEEGSPFENRLGRLALVGAYFFLELASAPGELTRETFADEHALGQQRYYDVMCLVFGSDPDIYMPVLAPGLYMVGREADERPDAFDDERIQDWLAKTDALNILPYERALRCQSEYTKYLASWDFLMEHFMVPQTQ